jgi:tight adherence protein B
MGARFSALVISAGIKARPSVILAVACAVFITCFALGLILVALPMGSLSSNKILMLATFAAAVSFALPLLYLIRLSERRKKKLVEQFPMALDVLVRSLRAGHPTLSALQIVSSELSDPLGSEFGLALDEVNYGADVRDALQNMADRCDSEDIQIFVVCLSVQAETGGNLAEILAGLAAVIRERISMLMKVRALSSEGRMTGVMLTALPIVTFVGLFLLNPGFYLDISGDPAFLPGFGGLLLSFIVGSLWIRRLVNLKV